MQRVPVVGVMGGASVDETVAATARQVGRRVAEHGWTLLTGGRDAGVMRAAARGARSAEGAVIGVLPTADPDAEGTSPDLTHRVATGLGDGRNLVNVLSSDAVVACRGGAGTLSEVALAVETRTPAVLVGWPDGEVPDQVADGLERAPDARQAVDAVAEVVEP
jgi:uncharacterized protein (TIGR00725 family)